MGRRRTFIFDGLGVSAGVAIGSAYVFEAHGAETEEQQVAADEIDDEIAVFHQALEMARKEVLDLGRAVAERLDQQQAAIFDAHVAMLGDPLIVERTVSRIRETHRNAEYVLWAIAKDIGDQLSALGDVYFSERTHDLYDVARRVIKFIRQIKNPGLSQIPPGSIIVANDLGPSETAALRRDEIAAFCTNAGGATSHTAIMAKALGIPAVVGLDFITHYVRTNDMLIIDGYEGTVILNPSAEQISYYREQAERHAAQQHELAGQSRLPAVTTDGTRISLEANIEFDLELAAVDRAGADGIGLYRTEYLFIQRDTLPTEAEQEAAYRTVFTAMGDRPVVVRTLDVGGDKLSETIRTPTEANPFLGLRAIRLCLAYPDLFRSQLRPLLRAAAGRELDVLIPMVSSPDEIVATRGFISEVKEQLQEAGESLPKRIRVGAMVEIPSAAIEAGTLAKYVDFFSIGTNDLTQYTLAVDRVNKMVSHLYHETHPAVLRLIHGVVVAAREMKIPVSVCGEMAGNPSLALLLVGLGVRSLSMSPSQIGIVRRSIRESSREALEKLAHSVLTCHSSGEVRDALSRHLADRAQA
ncbi:phosphoenolpyruvate--protein phosphotransferase [bacterium]|nr:phosphoenolpyruvate--protein phosphotransferase [bacterium]